jgi:pilus assembly protein Flp/PilA
MLEAVKNFAVNFMRDEEGAQILEYGLIIAIVSLASIIALSLIAGSQGNPFANFIGRATTCLTTATCL